ncbi:cytochrome C oxidase subunit IV family protein [bacterium]|nr:cytochrome C oxidase subunit IV family protein [bacterium]
MSTDHQEPNYMAVFVALTILTALEIGVVFVPIGKIVIAVALILLALAKAALVALYFMHLRYEKFALGIIAFTPLILCTLLILSLLPDLTGTDHRSDGPHEAGVGMVEQPISDENQQVSEN